MRVEAMHIANGIVNGQVSGVFAAVSLAALAFCVLRSRADLDDRLAPMAGLVAAFIFAVQMLTFQVLPGVSGHLLGGALAVVLVGPWVGALCVATVLIVQCLLFADGGLTALGLNIFNLAVLGTGVSLFTRGLQILGQADTDRARVGVPTGQRAPRRAGVTMVMRSPPARQDGWPPVDGT